MHYNNVNYAITVLPWNKGLKTNCTSHKLNKTAFYKLKKHHCTVPD